MILNFEVIQAAGITAGDLARIVEIPKPYGGVATISRTTAFNWTRGSQPSSFSTEYVLRLLFAIEAAVKEKKLPLKIGTKRTERTDRLKAVITQYM